MKKIKLHDGRKLIAVSIPEDALDPRITVVGHGESDLHWFIPTLKRFSEGIALPGGADWMILGSAKDLTIEQSVQLVRIDEEVSYWDSPDAVFYADYTGKRCFSDPLQSWHSFCRFYRIRPESLILIQNV